MLCCMYSFLKNASQAIDVMGGSAAVSRSFDGKMDRRVVANWKTRGFPPEAYAVLVPMLLATGIPFDRYKLFRQYPPAKRGKNGEPR